VVSSFIYADRPHVPSLMLKGGQTYRIIADHLGSVRRVVDITTGAIAQRMSYDEYGNVVEDTNPGFQPFGYAGGLHDRDTGLVRFGARDYDALTGRWTAKDPIGFGGGDTTLNPYVGGNPINFVDPTVLKAYTACETQALLDQARADMSASPFFQRFNNAMGNHTEFRKFDFKVNQPNYTFTSDGQTMSAASFGNYIAGYSGIYFGGRVGLAGVLGAGIWYDAGDAIWGTGSFDFDADSVLDISRGAFRAKQEQRGKNSTDPCGCGGN